MAREIEARLKISAVDRTAKAFETLERRLKRAEASSRKATAMQKQTAAFERTAAGIDRSIIAGTGAVMGAFAAAGGVRAGLGALVSFQDGLVAVQKKAGLTEEQMKAVGEEVKALATSGKLAVPMEEILGAYERGAAAGLPLDELKEFATLSAKAADAFDMAAADVGNAAAGFKVGLGVPMTEMQKFFDLINALGDSGIADEKDIINFLDRAGAQLKNFGMNAKQAAAYGATLLNLKMRPEVAAGMMSAMTANLIAPQNMSKKGQSALKSVVGDLRTFKKEMKGDAPAALRKFLGSVAKLDKFRRAEVLGAIFGKEWSDEIMRLVGSLDEADRNLKQADDEKSWLGSLDKAYALKLKTLSSRWQDFKNRLGVISIDVGEMGMPALEGALQKSIDLAKDLRDGFKAFGEGLDMKALDEAQKSLERLKDEALRLFGLKAQDTEIASFFKDLSETVNQIAEGIKSSEQIIDRILHPEKHSALATSEQNQKNQADAKARIESGEAGWYERIQEYLAGTLLGTGGTPGGAPAVEPNGYVGGAVGSAIDWLLPRIVDLHNSMNGANKWLGEGALPGFLGLPETGQTPEAGTKGLLPSFSDPPGPSAASGYSPNDLAAAATASMPQPAGFKMQFGGPSPDALRVAMEGVGSPISEAGATAATSIEGAAQKLQEAATRIGDEGRRAAEAISSARITVPAMPGGRGANANLGQSMPDAGTPGG